MTDVEIIEACLGGDKDIFAELINRYKNLVFSIILRMTKDSEEADDLAQDIFIKMYKNLSSYSPEYKFSTWVMRISSNHIIDYHRKRKQETIPLDTAIIPPDTDGTPETLFIQKEERQQIKKLVDDLPLMYRIPIIMYHQEGMSYQEIADKVGEPLSKIKNRIYRGRKLLKAGLTTEP
jgi:RNA polymerase sigma-70 factor (ECF subfamily)